MYTVSSVVKTMLSYFGNNFAKCWPYLVIFCQTLAWTVVTHLCKCCSQHLLVWLLYINQNKPLDDVRFIADNNLSAPLTASTMLMTNADIVWYSHEWYVVIILCLFMYVAYIVTVLSCIDFVDYSVAWLLHSRSHLSSRFLQYAAVFVDQWCSSDVSLHVQSVWQRHRGQGAGLTVTSHLYRCLLIVFLSAKQ